METAEHRSEAPVFKADDDGSRAKALWEMLQSEGWEILNQRFFSFKNGDKSLRGKVDREVRRTIPSEGSRDYWAGKADLLVHVPSWIYKTIEEGKKRE